MRRRWRRWLCRVLGHRHGRVDLQAMAQRMEFYQVIEQCPRCGQVWYP